MRPIVYDVAMTLDGFIGRHDGSIDGFVPDGPHVVDYRRRLEKYGTVLMGRATYEFGYQFGLQAGERAYPHMEHYIFSDSLQLESTQVNVIGRDRMDIVRQLKAAKGGEIYLCGGGMLAGHLLDLGLIDRMVVKLNPAIFGSGIRAFGSSKRRAVLSLDQCQAYENGVTLLEYDVTYER